MAGVQEFGMETGRMGKPRSTPSIDVAHGLRIVWCVLTHVCQLGDVPKTESLVD